MHSIRSVLTVSALQLQQRGAEEHAAAALVQWWKARQRIAVLRRKMQAEADAFGNLKAAIDQLSSGQLPFERAVLLLRGQQFGEMFQKVRAVAAFWKERA
jgi:hypothetical protein